MVELDRTEQRIVGVLIEKQLSVPDSYPLSENALVDGCNQKNNRDPVTELASFQVAGALMALQQQGIVARVDGGGRVPRFRHKLDEVLALSPQDLPVLAELLLRGPQAAGALKPRVARMGLHAALEQLDAQLHQLAGRSPPLVELLPLGPRERDRRWRHRLGDGGDAGAAHPLPAAAAAAAPSVAATGIAPGERIAAPAADGELRARVAALEVDVRALQAQLARLAPPPQEDA